MLGELDGEPVLVRDGRLLLATFHPELTDDPARARAVPRARRGGGRCPGTLSGARSSTRRARPTRSAASSSRSSRARSSSRRKRGARTPPATSPCRTRSRRLARTRCPRTTSSARSRRDRGGCGGLELRDRRLRGYGPEGVAVLVEAAHGQPQPHSLRGQARCSRSTTATSERREPSPGSSSERA